MIIEIIGQNVPDAYAEAWWAMRHYKPILEDSRNGKVRVLPHPVFLTIKNPMERVLLDPIRDANPVFHVMEFVWMLAGSNDAVWLSQFNKRMLTYADSNVLKGAYGYRWQHPTDQLAHTIDLLRRDPGTRQAVISIWDPVQDGSGAQSSDRPCNTQIYFSCRASRLDMIVTNRSNDLVWGMMGANCVHFTFLHELIARAAGLSLGNYQVFTKNLHVYTSVPRYDDMYRSARVYDIYSNMSVMPYPLLQHNENWESLREDCRQLLEGVWADFETEWIKNVAWPMYNAYLDKGNRNEHIKRILAEDWRRAAEEWSSRRSDPSTQREDGVQGEKIPH